MRKINTTKSKAEAATEIHPTHALQLKRLNLVVGQLQGIQRMIEGRRYCPDILTQTRAASAALHKIEVEIFETHLGHCVNDAMKSKDRDEASKKIAELVALIRKF